MKIKIDLEALREHPNVQFKYKKPKRVVSRDPDMDALKDKFEHDMSKEVTDTRTETTY